MTYTSEKSADSCSQSMTFPTAAAIVLRPATQHSHRFLQPLR